MMMGGTFDSYARGAAPATQGDIPYSSNGTTISIGQGTTVRPVGWVSLSLTSPWVASASGATPAYCKDTLGRVQLRGTCKSGSTAALCTALPAGYRPTAALIAFLCATDNAGTYGTAVLTVTSAGVITVVALPVAATTYMSLDSIWFFTDQ